jgi:hypothetical protein
MTGYRTRGGENLKHKKKLALLRQFTGRSKTRYSLGGRVKGPRTSPSKISLPGQPRKEPQP